MMLSVFVAGFPLHKGGVPCFRTSSTPQFVPYMVSAPMIVYFHIFAQYLPSYRMDAQESKDSHTITATSEVPGLRPEDVVIQLQENCPTASSEHKTSNAVKEDGHTIGERHFGKFSRTLQLPNGIKIS